MSDGVSNTSGGVPASDKTAGWAEPEMTINGHALTVGQVMTIRAAIECLADDARDALADDQQPRELAAAYLARILEIRLMMEPQIPVNPLPPVFPLMSHR